MKETTKAIILQLLFLTIRVKKLLSPGKGTVLIAPDVPETNLGDQALLFGAINGIVNSGEKFCRIILAGNELPPPNQIEIIAKNKFELDKRFAIFFATDRAFIDTIRFYLCISAYKKAILVGADVIDGRYNQEEASRKIRIIHQISALGLHAKIISFSISEKMTALSKKAFSELPKDVCLIVRDPKSYSRLKAVTNCTLGADIAFLMSGREVAESKLTKHFKDWKTQNERNVLGLCLRQEDFENKFSIENFASLIDNITQRINLRIAYIPHHPKDIEILNKIYNATNEHSRSQAFRIETLPLAPEIKQIAGLCDFVITSRMHVAIASLGCNTPISCIPYAGKFEGLLQHFDIPGALFPVDKLLNGDIGAVEDYLVDRIQKKSETIALLEESLPKIQALSASSFSTE